VPSNTCSLIGRVAVFETALYGFEPHQVLNMETLIGFLGLGAVYSGIMVISSRNPIHSVFYLVLAFINASLLLVIMGVEFLSVLFIIVYVGAIAILFLFVVMMLNIKLVEIMDNTTRYVPIGFIIGLIFLSLISTLLDFEIFSQINGASKEDSLNTIVVYTQSNIEAIGNILYTEYYLYFLIASFILLVSMLGAIILTIYHSEKIKRQDLFSQIATEYSKTVEFANKDKDSQLK
jgi:NADH-quinone oxidoreductase subunit J